MYPMVYRYCGLVSVRGVEWREVMEGCFTGAMPYMDCGQPPS